MRSRRALAEAEFHHAQDIQKPGPTSLENGALFIKDGPTPKIQKEESAKFAEYWGKKSKVGGRPLEQQIPADVSFAHELGNLTYEQAVANESTAWKQRN